MSQWGSIPHAKQTSEQGLINYLQEHEAACGLGERGAAVSLPGGKRPRRALGRPPTPPFPSTALWVWPPVCPLLGFLQPTSLLVALGKSLPLPVPLFPLLQVTAPPTPSGASIRAFGERLTKCPALQHAVPVSPAFHGDTKAQSPTLEAEGCSARPALRGLLCPSDRQAAR